MSESVFVKVTSALVIGGQIAKKGEIIEVRPSEARDLLSRGKVVPATAADAPKSEKVEKVEEPAPVADLPEKSIEDEPLSTANIGLEEPATSGRKKK